MSEISVAETNNDAKTTLEYDLDNMGSGNNEGKTTLGYDLDNMGTGNNMNEQRIHIDNIEDSSSSGTQLSLNEIECNYLEEQANLKQRCKVLETMISQKDEFISLLEKEKHLLENEKEMERNLKESLEKKERNLQKENENLNTRVKCLIIEKENVVMRYATVEKNAICLKTAKETYERKEKNMSKEIDNLNSKIKSLNVEKTRITALFDNKCKDYEKLKCDFNNLETKSKWGTMKLKQELELKEDLEKQIEDLKLQLKSKGSEIISDIETEPHNQNLELQANLILFKHCSEEKDEKIEKLKKKVDLLQDEINKEKHKNNQLQVENNKQFEEIQDLQSSLDKQLIKVADRSALLADFQVKLNELESVKLHIKSTKQENLKLIASLEAAEQQYKDQIPVLENQKHHINELMKSNKDLSEALASVQNEHAACKSKILALNLENQRMLNEYRNFSEIIKDLENKLSSEKIERCDERNIMARHISEKSKLLDVANKKVEITNGDLEAIKNKHSQTIKELQREITSLKKQLEKIENENLHFEKTSDVETERSDDTDISSQRAISEHCKEDYASDATMKRMIDRILKLQHAIARQTEKIDFLENHSATLVQELQKKSKLIHHYMLREQSGTLTGKGHMSKQFSASALYGSSEISLELSLEINKKLQAVLEDTLLKNITLKENLDTLSFEMDKLKKETIKKK